MRVSAVRRWIGVLGLCSACAPAPDQGAPECTAVFYADADGDGHGDPSAFVTDCEAPAGYTEAPDDCDDTSAAVHPGADEICNEVDDDCDGTIDVDALDAQTWYVDHDEDGFGDDLATAVRCDTPVGHVDVGGDCDDSDATVAPSGTEICNAIDDDCDGLVDADDPTLADGETWYVDADADHFGDPKNPVTACSHPAGTIEDATDCNDASADAHPNGIEKCDGLDNDCDGLTDDEDEPPIDGSTTWYPDADADGLGSRTGSVVLCVAPKGFIENFEDCDDADPKVGEAGTAYLDNDLDGYGGPAAYIHCLSRSYVALGGDCDEFDSDVFPGATEVCNNKDDNCDDLVDEDDPLVEYDIWYADTDDDGFGDAGSTLGSCDPVTGYLETAGDCDDGDAEIHPGATEYCDAVDNDCSGAADEVVVYVDWYADDDADGYGDDGDTKNDCVQPSGYVLVSGDCDDSTDQVSPAAGEACLNGIDENCDGVSDNCRVMTSDADATVRGADSGRLGATLAVADMDGDGTADVVLGNPEFHTSTGGGSIFLGPVSGTVDVSDAITITATVGGSFLGEGLVAGDIDLDGYDDLVVLAPDEVSFSLTVSGIATYAFLGPVTADVATADADVTWLASDTSRQDGSTAALLPDFDGDAGPDLAIGLTEGGTGSPGAVSVVASTSSGKRDLGRDAIYVYEGYDSNDSFGHAIAAIGDQNADGIEDMAIGAYYGVSDHGEAYVVLGGDVPGTYQVELVASAIVAGPTTYDYLGRTLAGADYDQDGVTDLFVGADEAAGSAGAQSGVIAAFLGPVSGALAIADAEVRWESGDREDDLGSEHGLAVGDVDADKLPDVLIGSPQAGEGRVYLQIGPASGVIDVSLLVSFEASDIAQLGTSLGIVPDWTGDDEAEIAVGAPLVLDASRDIVGGAYVFYSDGIY
jgi:hypothetical protein